MGATLNKGKTPWENKYLKPLKTTVFKGIHEK